MTKVFISYSRKDKPVAEKLNIALKAINLESWIDWDDIPPTADWWHQIQKGIESADGFLFLISPDSIASPVCLQEIEYAIQNGKRIIPLVVREVDSNDVHPRLAQLNWIFFREQDLFNIALAKLEAGIKTDLAWVEFQRRLQVRAIEWERRRDNSLLLRGRDLRESEEQLAIAGQKDPLPTDLQRQYVLESRKAESKSRNRLVTASGVAVITLAGLLLFALFQLNASRASALAAQAQAAFADENYNAAGLLAYQSNRIHKNKIAEQVLGNIPYQNFPAAKALIYSAQISSVAWSMDGRLASSSWGNTVVIWDLTTRKPAQILSGHTGRVNSVAWSADGRLASASDDDTVIVWDFTTGLPAKVLRGHTDHVKTLAWSADGRLASGSDDNTIIVWDPIAGQPMQVLRGHSDHVNAVAWSVDGRLVSGSDDNTVVLWDLAAGVPAQILNGHGGHVNCLAWSTDGRLASGSRDNKIFIWDLGRGQPAQILSGHRDAITSVAWSPDGRLASSSDDNTLVLWDLSTGRPGQVLKGHTAGLTTVALSYPITSVAWSAKGELASGSTDETIMLWDLSSEKPAETLLNYSQTLAWSLDGRLASDSGKDIIIWDLDLGQPDIVLRGHTDSINSLAWSSDGRLASGSYDKTVIVWDLASGQPSQILQGHTEEVTSVAWSPDGRLASSSGGNSVIVWDLATGKPAQVLIEGQPYIGVSQAVAWSPDGRLASTLEEKIFIWDLATGHPAQTLTGHTSRIHGLAWSSDGRLVSAGEDDRIILWNLATGKPAKTLKMPTSFFKGIAWSSDGRLASASGSLDYIITIWDLSTGRPAQTLTAHSKFINSIAWSPDGRLASSAQDGTIRIARADLLRGNSCDWIYRNMTEDEWALYQGDIYIYRPACPNLERPVNTAGLAWITRHWTIPGRIGLLLVVMIVVLWGGIWIMRFIWRKLTRSVRQASPS